MHNLMSHGLQLLWMKNLNGSLLEPSQIRKHFGTTSDYKTCQQNMSRSYTLSLST
jgi:hypothetical protein